MTFAGVRYWIIATFGIILAGAAAQAQVGPPPPSFSKVHTPDTMGPGGVSTLTLTIDNSSSGTPATDLAFSDTLPAGVTIADSAISTSCLDGTVTGASGASTLTLSGGKVGAGETCTVTVNVTSSTAGTHTNLTGDLTSSLGNSGTATDDLTVVVTLPGFSKAVAPSTVFLGQTSTVTYTIDNTLNANPVGNLDFTESLPTGFTVASPSKASTTCVSASLPDTTLTAVPGSGTISLDADGNTFAPGFEVVAGGGSCTVSVDIVGGALGATTLTSGALLADFTSAGASSAVLTVNAPAGGLIFSKDFTDDPVSPDGTAALEFTIRNRDRSSSATDLAFTDDLAAMIPGTLFNSLLTNNCGGTVSGVGTTAITFSGGTVAAETDCTLSVAVQLPGGVAGGSYSNTTSALTGTIDGLPVTGNVATANLQVANIVRPVLTMEFVDDPVSASGTVTQRYTITNNDTVNILSDLTFDNELTTFLPFPVTVNLGVTSPPCGTGSTLGFVFPDTDRQGLRLTDGNIAPGGSCSFDVEITIPADMPGGSYPNTTGALSGTAGGLPVSGDAASDTLNVNNNVTLGLIKTFDADSAVAGGTAGVTFTLTSAAESASDATAVGFSDDLAAMLSGATFSSLANTCGGTATLSAGDTLLTLSGATISPDSSCTITAQVAFPGGASPGTVTNTTSALTATVAGLGITVPASSDTIYVAPFDASAFTKEFTPNLFLPGQSGVLRYTLDNSASPSDLAITFFTDNLGSVVSGFAATGPATTDTCGGTLSGTTFLIYTGGSILAGDSCTIEVPVLMPVAAASGNYTSISSSIAATVSGSAVIIAPMSTDLSVESQPLTLSKSFTDDPVAPGENATLEFTVENLSATEAALEIRFQDDLDAMLSGATVDSVLSNTCTGSGTSGVGSGLFDIYDGSIPAASTCTVQIAVAIPAGASPGTYTNTTTELRGDVGVTSFIGDTATDTLQVATFSAPTFSKAFSGRSSATGTVDLSFTITNTDSTTDLSDLRFSDDLSAVIPGLTATSLPATPCGAGSEISGSSFLTFSGGTLAPSASCTFSVTLQVPATASAGSFPNTTSELQIGSGFTVAPATASLVIEPSPGFVKAYDDGNIDQGATTTLTFTINNGASVLPATALDFTDNMPTGSEVADPSNATTTCTGGTLTAVSGTSTVSYTGGSVAAGASCTVSVDIYGAAGLSAVNTTGDLTSSLGNSGSASAALVVTAAPPPGFSKAYGNAALQEGETTTLTFSIDNSGSLLDATALDFTDTMPSASIVATPSNAATTCTGGTLTATSGSNVVSYTGGSLAAGASCTVSVDVYGNAELVGGTNTTGDLTSSLGNSGPASTGLSITAAPPLSLTKAFATASLIQGQSTQMTLTLQNTSLLEATGIAFSDTFPGGLALGTTPVVSNSCTGTLSAIAGDGIMSLSGGTLAASSSCVITVNIDTNFAGNLLNQITDLTSSLGASATASDTLNVSAAPIPGFSKAFSPSTIAEGGTSRLAFTIDNTGALVLANGVDFTDTLPSGLVLADPVNLASTCVAVDFTAVAGAGVFTSEDGNVPAGTSCTIAVDVLAINSTPTAKVNTSGNLVTTLGDSGPATATLTVNPAPVPAFSKAFSPAAVDLGAKSTLTFTIENTALIPAGSLSFTDALPAGMTVATDDANASTTCTGGTLTASEGASSVSYSSGSVAAATSCTVTLDVIAVAEGSQANTSSSLTSSIGTSGSASATLTVNPAPLPAFSKAFAPASVTLGEESTLTFTIDNTALVAATALTFSDPLPTGMTIATDDANASTTCPSGLVSAPLGGSTIGFSGATLPASQSCTVTVDVVTTQDGALVNTSGALSSGLGTSGSAIATLSVGGATVPTISKSFSPSAVAFGGEATLTLTIDNSAALVAAGNLNLTDAFPTGMSFAASPNQLTTCDGGTLSANVAGATLTYSGGSVAAGATCTITAQVTGLQAGGLVNMTDPVTSDLGTSGAATATLSVAEPVVPTLSKSFLPAVVDLGAQSTLTLSIDNSGSLVAADNLRLQDSFPAGLELAGAPASTCSGGSLSGVSGDTSLLYDGGSVAAGARCDITVLVQPTADGNLVNTTDALTSSLGTSPASSASLTVNAAPTPDFAKAFSPASVDQGAESTLTFTIDNSGSLLAATALAFTDDLPAGLTVATDDANASTTCTGGTLSAVEGRDSISYSGGSIAAGASCTISVDVLATGDSSVTNTTGDLTSSLGTSGTASATLTITGAPAPSFPMAFSPASVDQGAESTLTFTIDNSGSLLDATALTFTIPLPGIVTVATDDANASTTCTGGTLSAAEGASSISYSGGGLAAGGTCTVSVDVLATGGGAAVLSGTLDSSLGTSSVTSATLTITAAPAPGFAKVFASSTALQGEVMDLVFTIDNSGSLVAATALDFTDNFPTGLVVSDTPNLTTTCTGGSLSGTAGATSAGYSGGSVAAGDSCTVSVSVTADGAGTLTNVSGDLTSSLGNSGPATDVLTVTQAPVLQLTAAFSPTSIEQGQTATLTLSIENSGGLLEATSIEVSSTLPTGVSLASTPALTNTCGGAASTSGSDTLSLSGGTLAASSSCELSVAVTSTTVATHDFTSGTLTSSLGASGTASASLAVTAAPQAELSYSFSPDTIPQNGVSTLTFTLDNSTAHISYSGLGFGYSFPSGLSIADTPNVTSTCSGAATSGGTAGGTSFSVSSATVDALSTCQVSVDVTASGLGTIDPSTGSLSGWSGRVSSSPVTLTVVTPTTGTISFIQNTDTNGTFGFQSPTSELNFTIATVGGSGSFGPVRLEQGSYSVTQIRPDGAGNSALVCNDSDSVVDVTAGTMTLQLSAFENLVCTVTSVTSQQRTVDTINAFLARRADMILASEPSNGRRLDRLRRGAGHADVVTHTDGDLRSMTPFTFDLTSIGSGNYKFSTSLSQVERAATSFGLALGDPNGTAYVENRRWDLWTELSYQTFEAGGSNSGHFGIGYFGADYLVNENLLVGGLLQIDDMKDSDATAGSTIGGTGWMVGPYMTGRIGQNLYFDGRIAYGRSDNDISPFNTYTDKFKGERWLARAQLTGDHQYGAWTFQPNASLSYFQEQQESYVDGVGVTIPSQTVALGQFKFGPAVRGTFQTSGGLTYQPNFTLDMIYNFGQTRGVTTTNPDTPHTDGWRGRLKAGVNLATQGGATFNFSGIYDGIGRSDFESWGLSLEVNIPLAKPVAQ